MDIKATITSVRTLAFGDMYKITAYAGSVQYIGYTKTRMRALTDALHYFGVPLTSN